MSEERKDELVKEQDTAKQSLAESVEQPQDVVASTADAAAEKPLTDTEGGKSVAEGAGANQPVDGVEATETAPEAPAAEEQAAPEANAAKPNAEAAPAAEEEAAPEANAAKSDAEAAPAAEEEAAPEANAAKSDAEAAPKPARLTPEERAARRAAAAAAKAAKVAGGETEAATSSKAEKKSAAGTDTDGAAEAAEEPPKEPSPRQPYLDEITALIRERVGADAVEDAYINEADGHLPVVIVKNERWFRTAVLLREQLGLDYLINVSGVDYETYMEVVYHIESLQTRGRDCCMKVRADREAPSVASVTPVWSTANWPEREIYDLLGIDFPGHPDLRRIMMPDDWVGYPLRKDYEPLDPEV